MKTTARMDGNTLVVAIKSDSERDTFAGLSFDLKEVWDALSPEDKRSAVDLLLLDDALLRGALDRLTFESESWSSDDTATREEWLVKIGAVHTKDVENAEERAKKDRAERLATAHRCCVVVDQVRDHLRYAAEIPACCHASLSALSGLMWEGANRPPAVVPPHAPDAKEPA